MKRKVGRYEVGSEDKLAVAYERECTEYIKERVSNYEYLFFG